MPSLKSLQERGKRRIEIPDEDGGEPLELVIWPNKLTYALQEAMQDATKNDDEVQATRLFLSLVAEWNVKESDEPDAKPLPLDPDVLHQIGAPTLNEMYTKIREILAPNSLTSTASS